MKLLIYECADAPEHLRACAVYTEDGKTLPVAHYGRTPEAVRVAAERWWADESAKATKALVPRKRKSNADVGDVI